MSSEDNSEQSSGKLIRNPLVIAALITGTLGGLCKTLAYPALRRVLQVFGKLTTRGLK
jgi:hypothetical protein